MLWNFICRNFVKKLHNAISFKKGYYLMHYGFSNLFFQYTNCLWDILPIISPQLSLFFLQNDCYKQLHVIFCVWSENTLHMHTDKPLSITWIITKAPHLYIYLQNRWNGYYRIYSFWFLQLFYVCLLHIFRGTLSEKIIFFNFTHILGAAIIIASWRHDLRCDDPSSSRYGEPII